jgi:hypothetical protein
MAHSLWHENLYRWGLYITYLLFAITWLGLWSKAPEYLKVFEAVLQMYVAFFLIINFSPISRDKELNDFSKGIAFGAGLLLLSNYVLKHLLFLQSYFNLGSAINTSNLQSKDTSFADSFLKLRNNE